MSNTKKYKPQPYFNAAVMAELDEEDLAVEQNPYVRYSDRDAAARDTQDKEDKSATSDNKSDSNEATYEKRWKDLKKHYDTTVSELRTNIQDLEEKLQKKTDFKPPKTAEEIETFRQQHPEFYDVMLSVAYHQASELGSKSGNRIKQLEEKLAETEQARAFAEIGTAHPDYLSIVKSSTFLEWLDAQAPDIQAWVKENSSNATLFIRALDLYKMDSGITKQMPVRTERVSAETKMDTSAADDVSVSGKSVSVGDTNKRIWSRKEIRQLIADNKFEQYEEELDLAMAEGRIRD